MEIRFKLDKITYYFEYTNNKLFYTAKKDKYFVLPVLQGKQIIKDGVIGYQFDVTNKFSINPRNLEKSEIIINNKQIDPYDFIIDSDYLATSIIKRKINLSSPEKIKILTKTITNSTTSLEFEILLKNKQTKVFVCPIEVEDNEVVNGHIIYQISQPYFRLDFTTLNVAVYKIPVIVPYSNNKYNFYVYERDPKNEFMSKL